jgi:hypothetical protein
MAQYWAPFVLPDITKEVVIKSVKWVEALKDIDEAVADSTYLIFEVFCTVSTIPYAGILRHAYIDIHSSEIRLGLYLRLPGLGLLVANIFSFLGLDVQPLKSRRKRLLHASWLLIYRPQYWEVMKRCTFYLMVLKSTMTRER